MTLAHAAPLENRLRSLQLPGVICYLVSAAARYEFGASALHPAASLHRFVETKERRMAMCDSSQILVLADREG